VCKNLVYTVIPLFIDFFLLKLSFKYTISVFTKQNVLLNIYIPNFRTFQHFIKKLYSFLFLLKSYCFLYTGLSYYSDDILMPDCKFDLKHHKRDILVLFSCNGCLHHASIQFYRELYVKICWKWLLLQTSVNQIYVNEYHFGFQNITHKRKHCMNSPLFVSVFIFTRYFGSLFNIYLKRYV